MDLKKPLTFDEQLDKLAAHGMIITDREKAKDILKRVNYYRFTGYALQFRQDPSSSDYIVGTTFETVYHLYKVDEILRDIFRRYIEKAEVLHMDFQLLNVRRLRMISIMMRIISITKRVTGKLWKISAGRKIIIKIA